MNNAYSTIRSFFLPAVSNELGEDFFKLAWLVRLRWLALTGQVIFGVIGFRYILLYQAWAYPYFGTVIGLYLFNCHTTISLQKKTRLRPWTLFGQVTTDTIVFTALLIFAGGSRNPFVPLLVVHAVISAMILGQRQALCFWAVLLGCLLALFLFRDYQVISSEIYVTDYVPLIALAVSLLIVWGLTHWLSLTLGEARERLFESKTRKERIDHLLSLGALTAEFSHQFATPLNTVKMRAARLMRQELAGTVRNDVKVLFEASKHCEGILREMTEAPLDSSQLGFKEVRIAEYVKSIIERWRTTEPDCVVELSSVVDDAILCRLPPVVFSKSLVNLFENAVQLDFAPKVIHVEMKRLDKTVAISVLDRGPGWPLELKNSGIKPFSSHRADGTGLGLYNCYSLSEVLGGKFELLDRKGGGAIARFTLPIYA